MPAASAPALRANWRCDPTAGPCRHAGSPQISALVWGLPFGSRGSVHEVNAPRQLVARYGERNQPRLGRRGRAASNRLATTPALMATALATTRLRVGHTVWPTTSGTLPHWPRRLLMPTF